MSPQSRPEGAEHVCFASGQDTTDSINTCRGFTHPHMSKLTLNHKEHKTKEELKKPVAFTIGIKLAGVSGCEQKNKMNQATVLVL